MQQRAYSAAPQPGKARAGAARTGAAQTAAAKAGTTKTSGTKTGNTRAGGSTIPPEVAAAIAAQMKARSAAGTPQRAAGTRTQGTATHRAPKQHPVSHPIHRRAKILPSLALIFCLAALTRFAAGVGTALAEGPDAPAERVAALAEDRPAAPNVPAGTPTASTARPVPAAVATDPVESAEMALSLARRERALQEREQALAEREQILASAEARIQQQITALQTAERELAATMALAERAAEDDILRLVNVFESMKADEAALVFAEMDPGFAAGFIGRLRPEAAAAIMAGLEPRQAYTLSTIVAGRNALVPRN